MDELNETIFQQLEFLEESAANTTGPWRVKAVGITLDQVNKNRRLYPLNVAQAAVNDANQRIQAGENIDGKIEHPDFPDLNGTAFNWTRLGIEDKQIILEGYLLGTDAGRNLRAMHKGKMNIRLSQRAGGDSVVKGGYSEVTKFRIFGYDATGNPSDDAAGITILESNQSTNNGGNPTVDELQQQIKEFIDAQAGTFIRFDESTRSRMARAVKSQKPTSFDEAKQLLESQAGDYDAILESAKLNRDSTVERLQAEKALLEEEQNRREVDEYLTEQVKEADYPKSLEESYLAAVKAAKPANLEEAATVLEEQRKIFDPLAANMVLAGRGMNRARVTGSVIEKETGYPEFAKVSFEIGQKLEESHRGTVRDFSSPQTPSERLTANVLKLYDQKFGVKMHEESRLYESETTSDLNIQFSAIRAVIAEVYPALIAPMVYDFQTAKNSPENIGYEVFVGEDGYTKTVTDEDFNSGAFTDGQSDWIQLDNTFIQPGTVVVNVDGGGALITDDGTNYVVDYAKGQIKMLDGGSSDANVAAATAYEIDYVSTQIAKGENVPIEEAKLQIIWKNLGAQAIRLATDITKEAMIYGRSQAGWDPVTRTIASLAQQVRSKIDESIFYLGLSASLSVANNQAASVNIDADTAADDLIKAVGKAKVKVSNRGYTPTGVVCSATIADIMSNSEQFSQAGGRADSGLNSNGSIGRVKGLPVYEVEGGNYPDDFMQVVNRELVIHRVFVPMGIEGPIQSIDPATGKLLPAKKYYIEEFSGSDTPVHEKSSHVKLTTS